ncbi:MAG: bifunctional (p)ppGpp synthetase/guanosine-3',5'-bis(diphosphate) 3'-pyrophosphohydrolase, partial [Clostridiaceae bacterium]|nr:bifunctional (p)ppGpp synthetase/guanosine-3',5'-bis(diphosphate) 3'-pyrophosphohydrolase [Clostridiaceae bacterium]
QVMPVPPAAVAGAGEKGGRETTRTRPSKAADKGVIVKGVENCLVRLSRCCNPVPGDEIVGYVTRGQGVAVHRTDCSNVRQLLRDSSGSVRDAERASRLIDVTWAEEETGATYQVELRITALDRRHLLADISNAIADEKISILSGQLTAMKDVTATIKMLVEVNGQNQLDRVIGRLKAIRDVLDVRRSG